MKICSFQVVCMAKGELAGMGMGRSSPALEIIDSVTLCHLQKEAVVTQFRQLAERSVHGGLSPTALPGAASPRALPEFAKIDTFLSSRI